MKKDVRRAFALICLLAFCFASQMSAQTYKYKYSADKGDGTYVNPIINSDFPDCDVIRVGDTYYFIGTTMYHFPGATMLKSKDLVNWEYCANPLLQIEDNDAYNLLNGGAHYAQGMWASSLNYHDGKFYIYFISYGRNGYDNGRNILLTATDPEGEWKMQYWPEHYYDSGWLFDDGENGDGFVYVACGIGNIYVNKLNAKTLAKISSTQVVFNKDGYEGSHMYHIGDYYYIYVTTGGYWKGQTIYRSKNPMGPYEEVPYTLFQGDAVHQGALVETQTGEWWTILFKDAGPIGRIPFLEPVEWKNGWPIIGNNGRDVSRNGAKFRKPNVGAEYPKTYLPTNDTFSSDTLRMQWQWNHNPQSEAWSLTERPGWMRLYSCTVCDNLMKARGSLTQRINGFYSEGSSTTTPNYGTAKLDLSGMQNGDVAGLAVVQNPYSFIAVKMVDGKKYLFSQRFKFDGQKPELQQELNGKELTSDTIYLRALTKFSDKSCAYYYSYKPTTGFVKWGVTMTMNYTLDHFVGQRYYLFNYSTITTGGHIDIDWFTTEQNAPVEDFDRLDAEMELPEPEPVEAWTGFPFTADKFDANILGTGTLKPAIKQIVTSKSGMAGWHYPEPWDLSAHKYIVVRLLKTATCSPAVCISDGANIWTEPYKAAFAKSSKELIIDLNDMISPSGRRIDPSHITTIAFTTDGNSAGFYVKEIFVSDDGATETGITSAPLAPSSSAIFDLSGRRQNAVGHGIYIKNNKKIILK